MNTHILWKPEAGTCACCNRSLDHVRRFTSENHHTVYCSVCWSLFLSECNVEHSTWTRDVDLCWEDDVALELECQGDLDGAAQGTSDWN